MFETIFLQSNTYEMWAGNDPPAILLSALEFVSMAHEAELLHLLLECLDSVSLPFLIQIKAWLSMFRGKIPWLKYLTAAIYTGDSWSEFLVPGLGLASPNCCSHWRNEPKSGRSISLCMPYCIYPDLQK